MSETIRYTRLGKEDLNFGTGTFEVRLADGRVVTLTQIDLADILSDATLSSASLTLTTITVTTLTVSGVLSATGTLRVPEKADPGSPVSGELWINSGSTVLEYADDQGTPTSHALVGDDTTQTLTNKTLTSPTLASPVFSGTSSGTYTLAGTITITSPTLTGATLTGATLTGATSIGAGATLTSVTLVSPSITTPIFTGPLSLASGQIAFPSGQQQSADANTLDDYEEGEWTPVVGGTATYTQQKGTYVKIGRLITVSCLLTINAIGTGSQTTISGLPFTVDSLNGIDGIGAVYFSSLSQNVVYVAARAIVTTTSVSLQSLLAAGASVAANNIIGSGTVLEFVISYETDG